MTDENKTTEENTPPVVPDKEAPVGGTEVVAPGDTGKTEEVQVEDVGSKTPENPPVVTPDKEEADQSKQSYDALRVKLTEQGTELNSYKKKYDEEQIQKKAHVEELEAYKKWYDQYYPIMNELWQDEAVRPRIEGGAKPRTITAEDAEKIADKKLQEYRDQTQFERTVDSWVQSHPDVKGDLAKQIYQFLEKNDLNPTPEMLETAYVFCTKDKLKEIGAKEKEILEKKVSDAAVGGGGANTPGKPGNPVDDLFATPVSNFYPGPKL